MKKILMITLALTLCAGAAMADHIGIYADAAGNSCALTTLVPFPGVNNFYVIHKFNAAGSTASQFKVNDTTGGIQAVASTPFLSIGTFYTDMSITYGGCLVGDIAVGTLGFYFIAPPTCTQNLEIVPAPTTPIPGAVAVVTCDFVAKPATGGRAFAGPNSNQCPGGCNEPLATNEATWGSIKALYR